MDRDQLIAEIKKQLQEELKNYTKPMVNMIPDQQKGQAKELKNEITNLVKEHPLSALALGVFAGFIFGRLFCKRGND